MEGKGLCFAAEAFTSFSQSLHPVFILELRRREGGREGGIIILLVAMERGEGKVCGAQGAPRSPRSASRKAQPSLSCWACFYHQTNI